MPPAPLLAHRPYWLTGILAHCPSVLCSPQHGAMPRTGANILGQAGRIQGRNLLALPLLCDAEQVPNPLWALVSSFIVKNQPNLMVSASPFSSDIKGTINQTLRRALP